MAGLATERINEIYAELKQKFGRGGGFQPLELEILSIKQYLDEQQLRERPSRKVSLLAHLTGNNDLR